MLQQALDTAAGPVTVPIHHITIKQVFSSNRTIVISPTALFASVDHDKANMPSEMSLLLGFLSFT
jgi:hypothetical protein